MTLLVELPASEAQATAEALGYARVRAPAVERVDDAPQRAQASKPTNPPDAQPEVPARTAETQRVEFWHVARHDVAREMPHVLVVDDEPAIRRILNDLLMNEGFRVLGAGNGIEALAVLERQAVDLVISDMKMPEMGGMELLKQLAERHPHVGTIVITGFSTVETAVESMKHGALDYVMKPFNVDQLMRAVYGALAQQRLDAKASDGLPARFWRVVRNAKHESSFTPVKGGKPGMPSVLVVDEEPAIRAILSDLLVHEDCRALTAANGKEALSVLERRSVDLVICEQTMREMGGLELLKHFSETHPHILTIILTSSATVETAIEFMKRGAFDYVMKPFNVDQLMRTVHRALAQQRFMAEHGGSRDAVSQALAQRTKGDMRAMPPLEPFGEWARLWPRLYDLIADRVPGRSPDVRAIVRDVSRGRPIESLPRLTIRRWPERLLFWADADEGSVLLWPDRNAIGARLKPLCGRLRFGGPGRWQPGESVLRLDTVPDRARAFAVRVESQGGRATALTLCDQRVPGWRRSAWAATASAGDRAQRAHRLRVMLSAVGVVQPGLLRAVRALLPMSDADVQTELDVWRGAGVERRGVDGLMFAPANAEAWRAEFARLPKDLQEEVWQTVVKWRAHAPSELKHIESLLWTRLGAATPPLFDPAMARAFLDGVSRKMCGGRSKTLRVFARVASEQLLAFATPDDPLRAVVSQLWFAGHHGMAVDVPTQLDATQAAAMLDPQEKQRDALRLSEGGVGLGGRKGVTLREVAWAHGAWKVAVDDGPLRQGDPTLKIPLAGREAITLSTGFERIELKTMQRPIWADSMTRDANGLHAEIEAMGLTLRWVVDGEGRWVGPGGVGVDEFGVFEDVRIADVQVRFRLIPAGTFMMGSPDNEEGRYDDEGPQHQVTLTEPFWLAEAPVTQELWQAVTGENPSRFKGAERPVEKVSWDDVMQFIDKVEQSQSGLALRLPTEAQWEYACRVGTTTPRYGELDAVAWHTGNSESETHTVKQKQASPWGLFDMLGNVYEWTADRAYRTYLSGAVTNPTGPEEGSNRVSRGGSWSRSASLVRAACRRGNPPGRRDVSLGFRLSRGPAPSARSAERAEPASTQRSEPPARSDGAEGQARSAGGGASPEGSRPKEAAQTKRSGFSPRARRKEDQP